jgi:translocation and assembly module TamA
VVFAALYGAQQVQAADVQSYRVEFTATGNRELDSTLKLASKLQELRKADPVDLLGVMIRARVDIVRLGKVLESFGYYQGTVVIEINGVAVDDPAAQDLLSAHSKGDAARCVITVQLGPLYHLGRIDIDGVVPDAARRTLRLATGAPAVASDVLEAGERLQATLEELSFAYAKVDPPVAYEDPVHRVLDIRFHAQTGPSTRVGEIRFVGLQLVHEAMLRKRIRLRTGDPYRASQVELARQDLLALGVFASVGVRLADSPDEQARVPIIFSVRERRRHAVGVNAAYSNDLGASGGFTWSNRNFFGGAEHLTLAASAINIGGNATTGIGYDFSAKYLIPDMRRRDQTLQFAVSALKQSLDTYDQTAQSAGVTWRRKLTDVWGVSAGASATVNTVVQEGDTRHYTLLAAPLTASYDSTNLASPLAEPDRGMRLTCTITPTLSVGNPNAIFVVTQVAISQYLDLSSLVQSDAGRTVLALRALGGLAKGAGALDLPPDQRFYAGGSGTIRGYRYQSVGPQFPDGTPSGGTAIAAGSIELRQRFGTQFGVVLFVDGGAVAQSDSPIAGKFRIGLGTGARYYSPLGAIRADVAIPTQRQPGDDRFEVYIGLGQAF